MSAEIPFEQRFAEIYPSLYPELKAKKEEDWPKNLTQYVSQQEETLTEVQKDFFAAIRASDLKTVISLIDQENAKPDFRLSVLLPSVDYWQMTNPLHPAQPHYSDEIRDLIWNLIILRSDEHTFDELLRWAIVLYQSDDVMQAFIDDLDSVDAQGLTPLHLACFFNQENTVAFLLAQEACPLHKDKAGNLPLHYACSNHHLGIVQRLLSAMKDLSCIPDILENGATYSDEIRKALQLYAEISARASKKKTPTMAAAFLERNSVHKLNPAAPRKPVQLLPDLTALWHKNAKAVEDTRVAEAKKAQEAEAKRQKIGN